MTSSNNFSNLCHNIQLPQIPEYILLEPHTVETSVHPNWEKTEREVGWGKGTYQNGYGHFCALSHNAHQVKNKLKRPPNSTLGRHSWKHSGNIPFFKLVSFLQLSVYPLQIPKPPSVKLTNEAIKFRVSNSFELHLLSESFNIPTVGSQSSSGLFSTLGSLFSRDHQLTLFCHSLPEGERKRETEGNEHFSEWNTSCLWFFCWREISHAFSKKRLALWTRSLQFPVLSYPI